MNLIEWQEELKRLRDLHEAEATRRSVDAELGCCEWESFMPESYWHVKEMTERLEDNQVFIDRIKELTDAAAAYVAFKPVEGSRDRHEAYRNLVDVLAKGQA